MDIAAALADATAAAVADVPVPADTPEPVDPLAGAADPADPAAPVATAPDEGDEEGAEIEGDAEGADGAAEGAAEGEVEGDELVVPEGYVAPPVIADGLAAEFVLRDEYGEVEVPALMVEYKANGKVRTDRLDQVVRLAQFGVYNQEREEKIKAAEALIPERDALQESLQTLEAQVERMLTDPAFFDRVLAAYEEQTTPEAEARRAKDEVAALRIQHDMEKIQAQGQTFHSTEIEPALTAIAQAFPTVTEAELAEQLGMAMTAHAEEAPNGELYVPPSRYDAVRKYIIDTLAPLASAWHQRRSAKTPAPPAAPAPDRDLAAARADAQKAKRQVGQLTKPVSAGRGASGVTARDAAPARKAPASLDDAVSSALEEALASVR